MGVVGVRAVAVEDLDGIVELGAASLPAVLIISVDELHHRPPAGRVYRRTFRHTEVQGGLPPVREAAVVPLIQAVGPPRREGKLVDKVGIVGKLAVVAVGVVHFIAVAVPSLAGARL